MRKLTVTGVVAALLICSLFTGCGRDDNSSDTNSSSSTTTTTTTKRDESSAVKEESSRNENSSMADGTTTSDRDSIMDDVNDAADSIGDAVTGVLTDATKPIGSSTSTT